MTRRYDGPMGIFEDTEQTSRWVGTIEVPDGYNGRRTVVQLVKDGAEVLAVAPFGYYHLGAAPWGTKVLWLREPTMFAICPTVAQ